MNHSMINSMMGMRTIQHKLNTIANNLSNMDTLGYKSKDATFESILTSEIQNQPVEKQEVGRHTPNGLRLGYGVKESLIQTDFTQGSTKETGIKTDLMIQGDGFFQVSRRPITNSDGSVTHTDLRLTRDGNFKLSPNPKNSESQFLVTTQGDYVLDNIGFPIQIPTKYDFKILSDGNIQLTKKDNPKDVSIATEGIGVYGVKNTEVLQSVGDNAYKIPNNSFLDQNGKFIETNEHVFLMNDKSKFAVVQGALESSNVQVQKEMVDMIEAQRTYQMNARALSYSDQMMDIMNRIYRG